MPAVYQPSVPTGNVNLDQDYLNLQQNAQSLDTIFGIDHLPFSNTTAQQGFHTNIHFVPSQSGRSSQVGVNPPSLPVELTGFGQLFSATCNDGYDTNQSLFWVTKTSINQRRLAQLTMNFTPSGNSHNGATFLPGAMVFQFGKDNVGAGITTINFDVPFKHNCFAVVATPNMASDPGAGYKFGVSNFTLSSFDFYQSIGTPSPVFWMAIGD